MKSIAKDRCGYTGYKCTGIAKLDEAFITKVAGVDNYENLPVKIEGMVTSVDVIKDMSIDWSPESSCWQTAGVSDGGFLDLLSKYGDKVVYRAMQALSQYVPYKENLIDFKPDDTELKMLPGMLEPPNIEPASDQITTDPDPVIHDIPGMIIQYIEALKCIIPDILPDPYVPDVCGIVGAITAIAGSDGICEALGIEHVSGKTVVSWSGEEEEPSLPTATYRIKGGELNINGHVTEVEPVTLTAPFTVYLNAGYTTTTAGEKTIKAEISTTRGADSMLIGSVYLLRSDDAATEGEDDDCPVETTKYKMWRVSQAACSSDITYPSLPDDVDPAWKPEICGLEDIIGSIVSETSCPNELIKLYTGKVIQKCKSSSTAAYKNYTFSVNVGSICNSCCNFQDGTGSEVERACREGLFGVHSVTRQYLIDGSYKYTGRLDDDGYPIYYNGKYYLYRRPGKWVIGWWRGNAQYFAYKLGDNPNGTWDGSPASGGSLTVSCYLSGVYTPNPSFTPVQPTWECPVSTNAPYYTVSGFDVNINGQPVTVPAGVDGSTDPIQAPFYVYLNVYKSSGLYSASMSLFKSAAAIESFNVGGVSYRTPVNLESTDECNTEATSSTNYNKKGAYVISQDLCPGTDLYVVDDVTSSLSAVVTTLLDVINVSGCIEDLSVKHITVTERGTGGVVKKWKESTVPVLTWSESEEEPEFDWDDCNWMITTPGSFLLDGVSCGISGETSTFHQITPPFSIWLTYPQSSVAGGTYVGAHIVTTSGTDYPPVGGDDWRRFCTQVGTVKAVKSSKAVDGMLCKTVKVTLDTCMDPIETSISGFQTELLLEGLVDCSVYEDFKIQKISGPTVFSEDQMPVSTIYRISGGNVSVNGVTHWVEGGIEIAAPFKAWVEVKTTTSDGMISVSFALKARNVDEYPENVLQIGGVRQIEFTK